MSHHYVPEAARGVRWDDPAFGIDWPPAEERDASPSEIGPGPITRAASSPAPSSRSAARRTTGYGRPERARDVEQGRAAVALVQHPQQGALVVGRRDGAAGRAVEAAPPELRLAVRAEVACTGGCSRAHRRARGTSRPPPPATRADPVEAVGGGVVAVELAVRRPHQRADGQVEPRASRTGARPRPTAPTGAPGAAPESRSTISIARSTSASPRRLRL